MTTEFEFNPELFEMCSFLPAQNLVMFSFTFKQPFIKLKFDIFISHSNSFFNSAEFQFSKPLKTFSLAIPNNTTFIHAIIYDSLHTTLFQKKKKESNNSGIGNIFLDHLSNGKVSQNDISEFFNHT